MSPTDAYLAGRGLVVLWQIRSWIMWICFLAMGGCTVAYVVSGGYQDDTRRRAAEEANEPWVLSAASFGGVQGSEFTLECSPDGRQHSVWGTGTFTDGSSICTAAVHAGLIEMGTGGEVRFTIVDGQDLYRGSTSNGVATSDYGPWPRSFQFISK